MKTEYTRIKILLCGQDTHFPDCKNNEELHLVHAVFEHSRQPQLHAVQILEIALYVALGQFIPQILPLLLLNF